MSVAQRTKSIFSWLRDRTNRTLLAMFTTEHAPSKGGVDANVDDMLFHRMQYKLLPIFKDSVHELSWTLLRMHGVVFKD